MKEKVVDYLCSNRALWHLFILHSLAWIIHGLVFANVRCISKETSLDIDELFNKTWTSIDSINEAAFRLDDSLKILIRFVYIYMNAFATLFLVWFCFYLQVILSYFDSRSEVCVDVINWLYMTRAFETSLGAAVFIEILISSTVEHLMRCLSDFIMFVCSFF